MYLFGPWRHAYLQLSIAHSIVEWISSNFRSYYYPHFTDEETNLEVLHNFSNIVWLATVSLPKPSYCSSICSSSFKIFLVSKASSKWSWILLITSRHMQNVLKIFATASQRWTIWKKFAVIYSTHFHDTVNGIDREFLFCYVI